MTLKNTASRYEGGSQNMAGMMALGASLELLLGLGIDGIGQRVLEVTDEACRRLESLGAQIVSHRDIIGDHDCRSGIVSFDLPGKKPQLVRQRVKEQGVALSCRAGHLRISPHAYNATEDLDRLEIVLRVEMLAGD
jgi:selenocysteine lyase/cysteine desulfurase